MSFFDFKDRADNLRIAFSSLQWYNFSIVTHIFQEIFSDNEKIMKNPLTFQVIGYIMCEYNKAKQKCFHLWGVVCTGQYLKHNSLFVLQCGRCISVRIIFLKRYFGGA